MISPLDLSSLPAWHPLTPTDAATDRRTNLVIGLASSEVRPRQKQYDYNEIQGKAEPNRAELAFSNNPLNLD